MSVRLLFGIIDGMEIEKREKLKKKGVLLLLLLIFAICAGCQKEKAEPEKKEEIPPKVVIENKTKEAQEEKQEPEILPEKKKIAIDAGHQASGNQEQEPIGPGAEEMKPKVSSGTTGIVTGVPEHILTLTVSLQLQSELAKRGYEVIMIRTSQDVNISNAERAKVANDAQADAFIRIHANGSKSVASKGALTMCMTPSNPYNGNLYADSRRLSENVLEHLCSTSGAIKNNIIETDTMSGINWCTVPVTIVEMGFMTNYEEDQQMQSSVYQAQMVQGIADGIDAYFGTGEN